RRNDVSEHESTEQQSSPGVTISRETFLKGGAATVGAALAATSGAGPAGAAIKNEAHFNVTGRAPVTITFAAWGGPDSIKPYQQSMQKFMARNPKIKVNLVAIPGAGWADLFEAIITRIA